MSRTRPSSGTAARGAGCPAGATLFELILALALTGIVMFVISMAVDLHLRTLRSGREEVDEAEIARAVLHRIARDLQNVVRTETVDMSVLEQMAVATSAAAAATGTSPTGQAGSGAGGMGQTQSGGGNISGSGESSSKTKSGSSGAKSSSSSSKSASSQSSSSASGTPSTSSASTGGGSSATGMTGDTSSTGQSATASTTSATAPGLYGSETGLQVDASRLPRVDEYDPTVVATDQGSVVKLASDVKTITYALRSDSTSSGGLAATGTAAGSGLLRREVDRAVAGFASGQSGQDTSSTDGELLAAEVSQLTFSYFDGQQWLTEWDSEQQGGLPLAIEIKIVLTPGVDADGQVSSAAAVATDPNADGSTDHQYRLVVHLPMARPASTSGASLEGLPTDASAAATATGGTP